MSFADIDLAWLLTALAILLIAAHGVGALFARFHQPPAIGEIVGGILLGPSALGRPVRPLSTGFSRRPVHRLPPSAPFTSSDCCCSCSRPGLRCDGCCNGMRPGRWADRVIGADSAVRRRPRLGSGPGNEQLYRDCGQPDGADPGVRDGGGGHQHPGDHADHARCRATGYSLFPHRAVGGRDRASSSTSSWPSPSGW